MITITCDHCKRQLRETNLIVLGSESNDLKYKNLTKEERVGGINEFGRYTDLHFCGKSCFVEHFFGKEKDVKI